MTNPLSGVRGRVTFAVLAVSAVVFSLLGTLGFLQIAHRGRDTIEQRISSVLTDLERSLRAHTGVLHIDTADGVTAGAYSPAEVPAPHRGEVVVTRQITLDGTKLVLQGRSSEVPLTDSLRSLFRGLWLAIPLATLTSALLAGMATHRALRPVGAITRFAGTVRQAPDGARVPVPPTGDEIEELAVTMNAMLERIDADRQAQRRFTSDAAHELRTPLMALRGEIEVAEKSDELEAATARRLLLLSDRLQQRIDDLVLLSTLDEARPLRLTPTDVVAMVRHEAAAIRTGISVVGDEVEVQADPLLLARAVRNLLANATRHAHDSVAVMVETTDHDVWVHVDDDGEGITAAHRDSVFQRFARVDDARSADDGGSGLGLAIVHSVAVAHGGDAVASSSPLGGARVSIRVPRSRA